MDLRVLLACRDQPVRRAQPVRKVLAQRAFRDRAVRPVLLAFKEQPVPLAFKAFRAPLACKAQRERQVRLELQVRLVLSERLAYKALAAQRVLLVQLAQAQPERLAQRVFKAILALQVPSVLLVSRVQLGYRVRLAQRV